MHSRFMLSETFRLKNFVRGSDPINSKFRFCLEKFNRVRPHKLPGRQFFASVWIFRMMRRKRRMERTAARVSVIQKACHTPAAPTARLKQ